MTNTREEIVATLMNAIALVTFTKKDGTLREMRCTLQEAFIPQKTTESTRKQNDEVLAVWDVDKDAWRSFRLDSVTDVKLEVA